MPQDFRRQRIPNAMPKTQVSRKGDGGQATAPQEACTHEREKGGMSDNEQKFCEQLKQLIQGMPDRSKLILLMRYGDGLNDAEIAAVLGEPENAAIVAADKMVLIGDLRRQLAEATKQAG